MADIYYFKQVSRDLLRKIGCVKRITSEDIPNIRDAMYAVPDIEAAKPSIYNSQKGIEFCPMKLPQINHLFTEPMDVSCVKIPAQCVEGGLGLEEFESYLRKLCMETSIKGYAIAWASKPEAGLAEQWESAKRGEVLKISRHIPARPEGREEYEKWAAETIVEPKMTLLAAPADSNLNKSKARRFRLGQLWAYLAWASATRR